MAAAFKTSPIALRRCAARTRTAARVPTRSSASARPVSPAILTSNVSVSMADYDTRLHFSVAQSALNFMVFYEKLGFLVDVEAIST